VLVVDPEITPVNRGAPLFDPEEVVDPVTEPEWPMIPVTRPADPVAPVAAPFKFGDSVTAMTAIETPETDPVSKGLP
jgi:hypothetical protein